MERDGHYFLVKALMIFLGFSKEEAEVIAYASQLTDDAMMYKGILIENLPEIAQTLVKEGLFESVCTAYKGIDLSNGIYSAVQEKVFIPFHYLPKNEYKKRNKNFRYKVSAGSGFAFSLLSRAIVVLNEAKTKEERLFGLIKLGIALHTYLDTFTHEGFSGRWNSGDNDIDDFQVFENKKWNNTSVLLDLIPKIGHAEPGPVPDLPYAIWRYKKRGKMITRNNPEIFMKAANSAYTLLSKIKGVSPEPFNSFSPLFEQCFAFKACLVKREENWAKVFPGISLFYDERSWQRLAIENQIPEDMLNIGIPRYRFQGDLKWFLFHLAAAEQRQWVLERIKPL